MRKRAKCPLGISREECDSFNGRMVNILLTLELPHAVANGAEGSMMRKMGNCSLGTSLLSREKSIEHFGDCR